LRTDSKISLDEAARHIGKSRQRLTNLLDGVATLTAEELRALAIFLGAGSGQLKDIEALGIDARRKNAAGDPYTDVGPESWRRVAYLEAKALVIFSYQKGIFPALIQSPEYVDALIKATEGIWLNELDYTARAAKVAFRIERQRLVFDSPEASKVHLFFTDDTFDTGVGETVIRAQLRHVISAIEQHENLTVRIVPTKACKNPAPHGGLTLFDFGTILRPIGIQPIIYGPSTYLDKAEDTARFSRAFDRFREIALSPEESLSAIEAKLKGTL